MQVERAATIPTRVPRARPKFVVFPVLLRGLLAGYLFFSRPFAYLHIPGTQLFIGEMVLMVGMVEAIRARVSIRRVLSRSPLLQVVLLFMVWCTLRLLASLLDPANSRMDAIRDSAIWYYGAFAFLVAAMELEDPTFLPRFLRWFRRLLPWFVVWAPIVVVLHSRAAFINVLVPDTPLPILALKPGDFACNLVMAITLLWLDLDCFRRRPPNWAQTALMVLALAGLAFVSTQTRGGFLGAAIAMVMAFGLLPQRKKGHLLRSAGPVLVLLVVVLALVNPKLQAARREISLFQVISNVTSIFSHGNDELSGTEEWRRTLWGAVVKDATSSRYLIAGQGFGPNIYQKYHPGYSDARGDLPLRSPHNSHLHIWARTGTVGLALWILVWGTFFGVLVREARRRSRLRPSLRSRVSVWVMATVLSVLVNTFFDPAIEGPHAGVWLWVLVGIAAAVTRRNSHFPIRATTPTHQEWRRSPVEVSATASR